MGNMIVWTKQNKNILKELDKTGRYIVKKEYIEKDLGEYAHLVLEVYHWLTRNSPTVSIKPKEVEYPIWVSLKQEATMLLDPNSVILELAIDINRIAYVNIDKWGTILNYSYIPVDQQDKQRHQAMLDSYGISDTHAYMSHFYPQIKREIIASWPRLFDDSIIIGGRNCYGIIWEIQKEWVKKVIQ